MTAPADVRSAARLPGWALQGLLALGTLALGFGLCYVLLAGKGAAPPPPPASEEEEGASNVVSIPEERWGAAGIRIEPAASTTLTESVWRTGRLALNEQSLAHLSPPVSGLVREVLVHEGQWVQAGDVLAVLDSREVGEAKLQLVKARLGLGAARSRHEWAGTISKNTEEMIAGMTEDLSISELEEAFRSRPIGDWRQQLMTAYSQRLLARTQMEGIQGAASRGSIPETTLRKLRADREAAEAAFLAAREELRYRARHDLLAGEQQLREAESTELIGRAQLLMMGFAEDEVEKMDPLAEGAKVSLYSIRAPFAGTVLHRDAVRGERVGPQTEMFTVADLSSLWLLGDIYEGDQPLVRGREGEQISFRTAGALSSTGQAKVLYTGDVVDDATRAITLVAVTDNPDRLLKPGQLVEVELTRSVGPVLQVPASALQRHGEETFVFLHRGGAEFEKVLVRPGREAGGRVEILGGLSQGQPVVTAGGFILKSELLKDLLAGD